MIFLVKLIYGETIAHKCGQSKEFQPKIFSCSIFSEHVVFVRQVADITRRQQYVHPTHHGDDVYRGMAMSRSDT